MNLGPTPSAEKYQNFDPWANQSNGRIPPLNTHNLRGINNNNFPSHRRGRSENVNIRRQNS